DASATHTWEIDQPAGVILASPGMIAKGIRWMFDRHSPFYVRPGLSTDLLRWGYQFYRHTTQAHVERSIPALKELSLFSKELYRHWAKDLPFDFGYGERGLLMLYQKKETEHEEKEVVQLVNKFGVEAHILTQEEIQKMEPDVRVKARGGVFYPGDTHLTPQILMTNLILFLKSNGVVFRSGVEVTGCITAEGKVQKIKSSEEEFETDAVVIAAGSWSGALASQLGITLPMQAGKGYSFTIPEVEKNIRIPSIFLEARVAVTPMGNDLRFGGTMEIAGVNHAIDMRRVKGIVDSIPSYYPEMKVGMPSVDKVWHGLRPCSPDGLPYIGRLNKFRNVIMASGHAMMGLSLGPGTGKLVSQILLEETPEVSLASFNPERYNS
ncbi:MAG TPA: FAD-dependent oxidoreductase, partial [Cyclobacteriaceae bacterium]|nr:FAD-dependent oxidoreductase [Cyclobacteriaceae bacterium]